MRVFLDANILFSAADKNSATRVLLKSIMKKGKVITNPHAWEEAYRNIQIKRPQHLKELDSLKDRIDFSNAFSRDFDIDIPDEDIPILAGAVGSECNYLLTGDKRHFGKFYGMTINGVKIVSGIMLADELSLV